MNFVELYEQDLYSAKRYAIYFADRCKLLEQRIEQLEQLCRDLYHAAWKHKCFAPDENNSGNCVNPEQDCEHCQWWKPAFERRMTDLGLLDGEQ